MKSVKTLARRIEKENVLFFAMSKDEKKVVIAKDCIARIKLNQFKIDKGMLIESFFDEVIENVMDTDSLKTAINSEKFPKCQVCAKGGLFMSYVGRTNEFNVCELSGDNDSDSAEHLKLFEIFSARELALIEYAFEGEQYLHYDEDYQPIFFDRKTKLKVQRFYVRYGGGFRGSVTSVENFESWNSDNDDKDARLTAICRNIIRNKGIFKM